jgi:hypothetical protein
LGAVVRPGGGSPQPRGGNGGGGGGRMEWTNQLKAKTRITSAGQGAGHDAKQGADKTLGKVWGKILRVSTVTTLSVDRHRRSLLVAIVRGFGDHPLLILHVPHRAYIVCVWFSS